MRDSAVCDECGFVRCKYSRYAKGSPRNEGTKETQEKCWQLLQRWKEEESEATLDEKATKMMECS